MIRFPPKKILVACDLSAASRPAWEVARDWARRFAAATEVVYVQPWNSAEDWVRQRSLGAALRRDLLAKVRGVVGPGPRLDLLEGDPRPGIVRLARRRRPHLIVVGTHGRTGLGLVWAGSVAEAVIRYAAVPVLAIRGRRGAVRSVLAPVEATDYSDYACVFAAGVAAALKARLTLFHAAPDPARCGAERERFRALIQHLPPDVRRACRPTVVLARGRAPQAIVAAARRHDLVVLSAHKRSALRDVLVGTTAARVLRRSPVSVLAVPAPERPFTTGRWGR